MESLSGIQKAILNPNTVALRNVNQALRIVHTCPRSLVNRTKVAGYWYELSPSIAVSVTYRNGDTHRMELAVAVRRSRTWPWQTWDYQAYLIADNNLEGPVAAINKEPSFDLSIPQSGTDIDDEEIDLILNKIEAGIQDILNARKQTAMKWLKRGGTTLAIIATVVAIGGGISWYVNNDNLEEARAQAAEQAKIEAANKAHWDAIAYFDGKGIKLQGEFITPGKAGVAALDRFAFSLIDEVPEFDDLLDNPRKLQITAGSSIEIASVPPGKGVRVATNAPKGHVVVNVLEDDGAVWLTALPDKDVSEGSPSPTYDVLIQSDTI